jgi:alkaline phosphatase
MNTISRRSFLTRTGAVAAAIGGAPHIALSADQLIAKTGQKPKRIIHVVSDGMSMGTLTCADLLSQIVRKKGLTWTALYNNPAARISIMNTRSLNSAVTDSSAASSAWGSGSRVVNGAVNVLPNGTLLTPLYPLFADAGWKTGLVTTAEVTHATPAGFAVSVKSRGNSDAIAVQYFERKVDVLLGGGAPFFSPNRRKDKRDLRGDFTKAGYAFVTDKKELNAAPLDKPLLGVFADGHLPYTLDQRNDAKLRDKVPTLAELVKAALARLERSEKFILQVEGARIDHAAHNSDAPAALNDQIALDEALDVILAFQQSNPDTLVVVTTDHANSNLGLNGMGGGYRTSNQRFATLTQAKMSFPEILKRIEKAGTKIKVTAHPSDAEDKLDVPDPMAKIDPNGKSEGDKDADKDDKDPKADTEKTKFTAAVQMSAYSIEPKKLIDIVAEGTGYRMSARRAALFASVIAGNGPQLYDQMNGVVNQLGQVLANRFGLGWTGNTHTADYVTVTAIGPGSELFTGFIQNTDVFRHYTSLAGIDFKNPSAPLIAKGGPEAAEVESSERYAYV